MQKAPPMGKAAVQARDRALQFRFEVDVWGTCHLLLHQGATLKVQQVYWLAFITAVIDVVIIFFVIIAGVK